MCLSFFLQFLQDTFIIVTNPEVNFLTKVHELIEKFTGGKKNYVIKPGVYPDKVQMKQMEPGMHEISQTTRTDMAIRAFVG